MYTQMPRQMTHEIYLITTREEMNIQEIKLILTFVQNQSEPGTHWTVPILGSTRKHPSRGPGKGCMCRDVLHQPSKMSFCCGWCCAGSSGQGLLTSHCPACTRCLGGTSSIPAGCHPMFQSELAWVFQCLKNYFKSLKALCDLNSWGSGLSKGRQASSNLLSTSM